MYARTLYGIGITIDKQIRIKSKNRTKYIDNQFIFEKMLKLFNKRKSFSINGTDKLDEHLEKKNKPWPKPHTIYTWVELSA